MPIQFAGVDLLLEDPQGSLCRFLDRFLSVEGMRLFGPPAAWIGMRDNPRSNVRQFTALPIPNYQDPPPLRVNSLYWPTGASRWGRGLFLTDDAGMEAILAQLEEDGGRGFSALLKIFDSDVNPESITGAWMYLLPARKVSGYDGDDSNGLWILPLVDQRYWWQYKQFEGLFNCQPWSQYFDALQTTLDIQDPWRDSIHSAYGSPHWLELNRRYDSAAMMLDAGAHCVGKRFVVDTHWTGDRVFENFAYLYGPDNATTVLNANLAAGASAGIIAGGEFSENNTTVAQAEELKLVFPNTTDTEVGDITSADLDGDVAGTALVIHEAANTASTTPAWRGSLTNQIASDLKKWSARLYDITYAGLVDWRPCGFDDYVEWFVANRGRDGRYRMQTRAVSMPYNFGVENMCHQQCSESSSSSSSSSGSSGSSGSGGGSSGTSGSSGGGGGSSGSGGPSMTSCWSLELAAMSRPSLPSQLFLQITSITVYNDLFGNPYISSPTMSPFALVPSGTLYRTAGPASNTACTASISNMYRWATIDPAIPFSIGHPHLFVEVSCGALVSNPSIQVHFVSAFSGTPNAGWTVAISGGFGGSGCEDFVIIPLSGSTFLGTFTMELYYSGGHAATIEWTISE